MRMNIIGGSNITALNENISKLNKSICEPYKDVIDLDLSIFELSCETNDLVPEELKNELSIVNDTIGRLIEFINSIAKLMEACDVLYNYLEQKYNIVNREYNIASKSMDGADMASYYKELNNVEEEKEDCKNKISTLLDLYDNSIIVKERLVFTKAKINVAIKELGVFSYDLNIMTKDDVLDKIQELRLAMMEYDKGNVYDKLTKEVDKCYAHLQSQGYELKNPYKDVNKKELKKERERTFNQIFNLRQCSFLLLEEIMSVNHKIADASIDKAVKLECRLKELENCERDTQRAIMYAEDKLKAINEVLTE